MADNTFPTVEDPPEEDAAFFVPRVAKPEEELDITPMIDITFLMLIYFLVASVPDPQTAVDVPKAHSGEGVIKNETLVLTVVDGGEGAAPVYLADGKIAGTLLSADPVQQANQIEEEVKKSFTSGKPNVLIKAEGNVAHREVDRVIKAISRIEGIQIHVGVLNAE